MTTDPREKIALPDWVPARAFEEWVRMRRKIKKPLTDHAVGLALKKLADLRAQGHDPEAVLNEATLGCWTGLWAPRGGKVTGKPDVRSKVREGGRF